MTSPIIGTSGIQLIGIMGHAGAGKDTIAEHIENRYENVYTEPFASPLKRAACHAFGVPLNSFNDRNLKEINNPYWNISPRKIAQFMGTEMFRESIDKLMACGGNFWVERHCGRLGGELLLEEDNQDGEYVSGDVVLVPDVRFQNEYDYIIDNGGIVINVDRPGYVGSVGISGHASENLSNISAHAESRTWWIRNHWSINELHAAVDKVIYDSQLALDRKESSITAADL